MYNQLVSIIMPAFNAERYIRDSIESVLQQQYSLFELIIIDDFSSDRTIDIVKDFNDGRIILIQNENMKGAAGARRTGINCAKGRYIAFLDSDDIWPISKLQLHIDYLIKNNVEFTYSDYYSFDVDVRTPIKYHKVDAEITYENLLRTCQIGCLTVVFDKSKFINIEYDNFPKEDYAFWLKLLKQCEKAYRVPDSYAYYRVNKNSLSSNKIKEIKKQWYVIRWVEKKSLISSIYCIASYMIHGFKKHYL